MSPVLLFFGLCIPFRAAIAYGSTKLPSAYLPYFGLLLLAVAFAMFYLYFTNSRLSAAEAGGVTWWAPYRLIIGALWLVAAIYALQGRRDLIWVPLAIDIVLGITLELFRIGGP